MISIKHTNACDEDFMRLCRQLDQYLNKIAGGVGNREKYIRYNNTQNIEAAFVAYYDQKPVGCAAVRTYTTDIAEVKRVFVNG